MCAFSATGSGNVMKCVCGAHGIYLKYVLFCRRRVLYICTIFRVRLSVGEHSLANWAATRNSVVPINNNRTANQFGIALRMQFQVNLYNVYTCSL